MLWGRGRELQEGKRVPKLPEHSARFVRSYKLVCLSLTHRRRVIDSQSLTQDRRPHLSRPVLLVLFVEKQDHTLTHHSLQHRGIQMFENMLKSVIM